MAVFAVLLPVAVVARDFASPMIDEVPDERVVDPTHPDKIAVSPAGVRLFNGRVRPTFDVVLRASGRSVPSANDQ